MTRTLRPISEKLAHRLGYPSKGALRKALQRAASSDEYGSVRARIGCVSALKIGARWRVVLPSDQELVAGDR